jgi:general nucleoside transport system ATP-binding protein
MSILYGFYEADSGEILIDGQPVVIARPADAIALGIGMVHQHFVLVDTFTVLENIILGTDGGAMLRPGAAAARQEVRRLEREYGLGVDPDAVVHLPVGALQRVEILKALYRRARILILDEPTGVLTPQETDQLFRILSALRSSGTTIVLITHKLREIMAVTDEVYVTRAGAVVAHRRTAATDPVELVELMVGRKVLLTVHKGRGRFGAPPLIAEGLTLRDDRGIARVDNVSFCVRAGEIVAVAGVSGNGQSELLELLAGIRPPTAGLFTANGRVVTPEAPSEPSGDAGNRRRPHTRGPSPLGTRHRLHCKRIGNTRLPARPRLFPMAAPDQAETAAPLRTVDGEVRCAPARVNAALGQFLWR